MKRIDQRSQRGAALITSLMLLLIMTIVAVVATQNSTLNYKMSMNAVGKEVAIVNSDSAAQQLANFFGGRTISSTVTINDLQTLEDFPDCLVTESNDLLVDTSAGVYPYDKAALTRDIDVACSSIEAELRLIRLNQGQLEGFDLSQLTGYERPLGTSGKFQIVEIDSAGQGPQDIPARVSLEYQLFFD